MPLSALDELLTYSIQKDQESQKEKAENKLYLMWLSGFVLAQIKGDSDYIAYDELLAEAFHGEDHREAKANSKKRTAEEILAEFEPIIERDRRKGGI